MSRELHRPVDPPRAPGDLDLDRYIAGECSPVESEAVARWLRGHRADAWAVEAIRSSVVRPMRDAEPDASEAVDGLLRRLGLREVTPAASPRPEGLAGPSAPARYRTGGLSRAREFGALVPRWPVLAAAVLTVVAVGRVASTAVRQPPAPDHTYATGPGRRATVHLSDGTRVTLAPQTTMTVRAGFGADHRDVRLAGQAYFDVTSAAGRPFTVRAGDVTSRVLGTEFVVRHYVGDPEVVVAVRSGKVTAGRRNPVVLTSNTLARITDSTIQLTTRADLRDYMEWRDGRLVFSGATAAEITAVLGHWYGLTFRFADAAMSSQSLSGVFDDRDPRQEVLQNLQILLGARMAFQGNVVTIMPRPAAATRRPRPDVLRDQNSIPTEVGR